VPSAYANAFEFGARDFGAEEILLPPLISPQSDLGRRADSRWALPQISSFLLIFRYPKEREGWFGKMLPYHHSLLSLCRLGNGIPSQKYLFPLNYTTVQSKHDVTYITSKTMQSTLKLKWLTSCGRGKFISCIGTNIIGVVKIKSTIATKTLINILKLLAHLIFCCPARSMSVNAILKMHFLSQPASRGRKQFP